MAKETIFLNPTSEEKVIAYLVSKYGFEPVPNQEKTFLYNLSGHVQTLIKDLPITHPTKLKIKEEGKFQKLTLSLSYRNLNYYFSLLLLPFIVITILVLSWPYTFLFTPFIAILYFYARLKAYSQFHVFYEKLKAEFVHLESQE